MSYHHLISSVRPAADWAEGYPLGNGRLGAMVVGGVSADRIALNHDLLWRRYIAYKPYGTRRDVEEIKTLCREKRFAEAEAVMSRTVPLTGQTLYINPFVPAGDLYIRLWHAVPAVNYRRTLDCSAALSFTEYSSGPVRFRRETFCSAADPVVVTRLSADAPGTLGGTVSASRIGDCDCTVSGIGSDSLLSYAGLFKEGAAFTVSHKIFCRGGRLKCIRSAYKAPGYLSEEITSLRYVYSTNEMFEEDSGLAIDFEGCSEVVVVTVISTDTEASYLGCTPAELNEKKLLRFEARYGDPVAGFGIILENHKAAFRAYFDRESVLFDEGSALPVPDLLRECREKNELLPEIAGKCFAFSRYLCIAAGMPQDNGEYPKAPINLQGLWNQDLYPAWDCDYHLDLNLQMCYWSMNAFHLKELNTPLRQWLERIADTARFSARDLYGCGGLALNGCCDFQNIGRTDNVGYFWTGAAAWLAQILWQQWEYERDESFLREFLYPYMLEIAAFYREFLIETPEGLLLPPFGASPEFQVIHDHASTFAFSASSIDLELIFFIFSHILTAGEILGITEDEACYKEILSRLPLPPVCKNGVLSEFYDTDYTAADKGHRHRSLLVGLCPGDRISFANCPETAEAAYRAILQRQEFGKASTQSLTYTWDAQMLARLGKGEEAYRQLIKYIDIHTLDNLLSTANDWNGAHGGLTWFLGQKVFQIEACINAGAAVLEMVFSDRGGIMWFLPALPRRLSSGKAVSLAARGGFDVSFSWSDCVVSEIEITSRLGSECRIRLPAGWAGAEARLGGQVVGRTGRNGSGILSFGTEKNRKYKIILSPL